MTDKVLNVFTKAELIEGIQSLSKYDRPQLITGMLFKKQDALIQEWGQNDEKLEKLSDELNKAEKNSEKDRYWDIYAKICDIMEKNEKINRQIDKISKLFDEVR